MRHSTISVKFILYMWGQSEYFFTSNISSWFFIISCSLVIALFVGFYITLILSSPFVVFFFYMDHVHSIKIPFRLVIWATIPILAISSNLILLFLYFPGFKNVKSLNISLVGVPSFSIGLGLGSFTSSSLNCCKDRSFFSTWKYEMLVQEF